MGQFFCWSSGATYTLVMLTVGDFNIHPYKVLLGDLGFWIVWTDSACDRADRQPLHFEPSERVIVLWHH